MSPTIATKSIDEMATSLAKSIDTYLTDKKTAEAELEKEKSKTIQSKVADGTSFEKAELEYMQENKELADFYTDLVTDNRKSLQAREEKYQKEMEALGQKTLTAGVDANGGYTVPVGFDRRLRELMFRESFLASNVERVEMSEETMQIPEQAGHVTANWIDEDVEIPESNATFVRPELKANALTALSSATRKLLTFSRISPGLAVFITRDISLQLVRAIDRSIIQGGGANGPTGIESEFKANGSKFTINSTANSLNKITLANFEQAFYALPSYHRRDMIIICEPGIIPVIKSLTTGTQGATYWTNPTETMRRHPNADGFWNNKPIYECEWLKKNYTIGGTIAANKAGAIVFFNPKKYYLGIAGRATIDFSDHAEYKKNNRVFRGFLFGDGKLSQTQLDGFSVLGYRATN